MKAVIFKKIGLSKNKGQKKGPRIKIQARFKIQYPMKNLYKCIGY